MGIDWFNLPDLVLLIVGFFFEHAVEEVTLYQYFLKNIFGALLDLLLNVLVFVYTGDTGAKIGIIITSVVIAISFVLLCCMDKNTPFSVKEYPFQGLLVMFMSYMSVLAIGLSLGILIKQQEHAVNSTIVLVILLGINGLWTFLVGSYGLSRALFEFWSMEVTGVIIAILLVAANFSLVVMEGLVAFPTDCWLHLDDLYLANTSSPECLSEKYYCQWCDCTQVGDGCLRGHVIDNTDPKLNSQSKCVSIDLGAGEKSFVASFALAFMHLFLMSCAGCLAVKKGRRKGDLLLFMLIFAVLILIAIGIPVTNFIGTSAIKKDIPPALKDLGFDYIDSFTGSKYSSFVRPPDYLTYNVTSKWTTGKTYDIAVASTILGSSMAGLMVIISCFLCFATRGNPTSP